MYDEKFLMFFKQAQQSFSGWDFSFVEDTGRMNSAMLSWSYGSLAIQYIYKAKTMLDMGTGGGELLSKLQPFPESVYATEAYGPNVPIAKKRLEPMGAKVIQIDDDDNLPFLDYQFDLVINKHESYSVKEVKRILANEGIFLTQQVGGQDYIEINEELGAPINNEYSHWNLNYAVKELENEGFYIKTAKEEFPVQRFYDIGALIYYLRAIPWQVSDFSPEKYIDALYKIHQKIEKEGFFEVKQHRFLVLATINK